MKKLSETFIFASNVPVYMGDIKSNNALSNCLCLKTEITEKPAVDLFGKGSDKIYVFLLRGTCVPRFISRIWKSLQLLISSFVLKN